MAKNKKYRPHNFVFDFIMCCITMGFWFVWIFVREMRNK